MRLISVAFVLSLLFLTSLLTPLRANAQPALELNPVKHDITPLSKGGITFPEVVQDQITVSGKTDPGTHIFVKKTLFSSIKESSVSVSPDGSFSTKITFEAGPGFTQGVENGEIKLSVVAEKASNTKEVRVSLENKRSSVSAPQTARAALKAGVAGYPHTFVAYNNPWSFSIGQYVNDQGAGVQTSKDQAAAQLGKFGAVSLHYTENSSSIALIKEKNPAAKVFAYINPMFCYRSSDPNSEYQKVVRKHPEWFLYPDVASRQNKTTPIVVSGSEQVMDLTTGWRNEIIKLSKAALAKGFDGLYVDCICDNPSLCYGYGSKTAPIGDWHAALKIYLDKVRVPGKLNFYNGQCPAMAPSNKDFLDRTEGWMDEGFISYKGWKRSAIDMPQYVAAKSKFAIFFAQNVSVNARHFYYTSALLSDGYFFFSPTNTQWFSDYGVYLGNPLGKAYQVPGLSGVWARDYTLAKVIVNPTPSKVTVKASGYTDTYGKTWPSVTIAPNDGIILKKKVTSARVG